MNNQEFLNELAKIKEEARSLTEKKDEIVRKTNQLFESNYQLAYQLGVDESMSYHDNDAHLIQDMTSGSREYLWLPSSWDRC